MGLAKRLLSHTSSRHTVPCNPGTVDLFLLLLLLLLVYVSVLSPVLMLMLMLMLVLVLRPG
jgi:hypothetical protein